MAAAAYNYFDKSLDQLTIAETAYLAGLPKAPSNYHPVRNYRRAIERRNWVIARMAENQFVSDEDATKAIAEELTPHFRPAGAQSPEAQFFAEEIRRWIQQNYGDQALYDGGLAVRSTFDPTLAALRREGAAQGSRRLRPAPRLARPGHARRSGDRVEKDARQKCRRWSTSPNGGWRPSRAYGATSCEASDFPTARKDAFRSPK